MVGETLAQTFEHLTSLTSLASRHSRLSPFASRLSLLATRRCRAKLKRGEIQGGLGLIGLLFLKTFASFACCWNCCRICCFCCCHQRYRRKNGGKNKNCSRSSTCSSSRQIQQMPRKTMSQHAPAPVESGSPTD